ncbi:MAG: hypothetical protein DMG70_13825 [Acidobacteria bacterium]|nr:MAG: hypothetical protein DMG70_13825 [Acidobacteriota bacterium]
MGKLVDTVADPAIPTLARALDPAELAKELSLLAFPQVDASQGLHLRVIQWTRASRCTFEVALRTASGWQELIGKVYAEDRSDIYQAMEEIRRAGFDAEDEFAIPRPVAFLAPLHLLLYEKVPGTRARALIVNPNASDRVLAVERCARWLARFQARAPRSGRAFRLHDYLISLEAWWRRFLDLALPFANKARRLFEQLNASAPGLNSTEMCAGHGDYTCAQVLLVQGRTVTIDWDTFNAADPSRDVARFLVDLKRMGLKYHGSMHAFDWAAEVFLKTYAATGHSYVPTHLAFQEAAICLERAKSDVDKQDRGCCERAEAMLDEGLRILDRGTCHC